MRSSQPAKQFSVWETLATTAPSDNGDTDDPGDPGSGNAQR